MTQKMIRILLIIKGFEALMSHKRNLMSQGFSITAEFDTPTAADILELEKESVDVAVIDGKVFKDEEIIRGYAEIIRQKFPAVKIIVLTPIESPYKFKWADARVGIFNHVGLEKEVKRKFLLVVQTNPAASAAIEEKMRAECHTIVGRASSALDASNMIYDIKDRGGRIDCVIVEDNPRTWSKGLVAALDRSFPKAVFIKGLNPENNIDELTTATSAN